MKFIGKHIAAETIRELFIYEPDSGSFFWRKKPSRNISVGSPAGYIKKDGYHHLGIDGHQIASHRVAWIYMHGTWPLHEIDHIDGNRLNNRIDNLREATRAENVRNRHARGWYFNKRERNYKAYIRLDGKQKLLGSFDTAEEARSVYLSATVKHYGEFSIVVSRGA